VNEFEDGRRLHVLRENIEKVRARIAVACERGRRDISEVTLIAVSKNFLSNVVRLGVECGLGDLGENRVQEAYTKYQELSDIRSSLRLHFIGHLQTNKVKEALEICDVIHSVDSLRLARALDERATRKIPAMLQVNVAKEETKHGFPVEEVDDAVKAVRALQSIDLIGLMTIAPAVGDHEEVRPVFARLREMNTRYGLKELSMGMTDDFEVAIEEGSTMVRVGRAIFGERS
jgi:PLP dependent protein